MKNIKTFEDVVFEPEHKILRFSELGKRDIRDKYGDLLKQLQEISLHLFDKSDKTTISCKITSVYNDENKEWVDGINLPDGEFSKLDINQLSELMKQKKIKSSLPCTIKFTDDKGKLLKNAVVNGYIKFFHPKVDKQNEPSMPWEKKYENKFQDIALDKIKKLGGFDKLPDIDKLALLGGSNNLDELKKLDLNKIFKENGGTFGFLEIKVRVKDVSEQPIKSKSNRQTKMAGKEGYLFPYIHYDDMNFGRGYVTVRFDNFIENDEMKGGGTYQEYDIYVKNIYPIGYDEIKSDFVKYKDKVEFEREEFLKNFDFDDDDEEPNSQY